MNRRIVFIALAVLLLAGAFAGGWYLGDRQGRATGFATGVRYGEVQASKKTPVPVRDRRHPVAELAETPAFQSLPVQGDEVETLATLANRAISPCREGSRRGVSLASSLLDEELNCAATTAQLRLGLAALRTWGGGAGASPEARGEALEEAVAVLRVERRQPVPTESHRPVRGNPDAAVTLTVFSDFQCPFCARGEALVETFLEAHGDRVRVVPRHLPLTRIHPAAWPAAVATEAAAEQGKYWEMHDALFESRDAVRSGDFASIAEGLGLDVAKFEADMAAPEIEAQIAADVALARELDIRSTPSTFVNGHYVRGAVPLKTLRQAVAAQRPMAQALVDAGTPKAGIYAALMAEAVAPSP